MQEIRDLYKDRQVCIAYPSPDRTDFRFNMSTLEIMNQNSGILPIRMINSVGPICVDNRNMLVNHCQKIGVTDILWLETDITFPINGLLRLLRHDKDIVGCTHAGKGGDSAIQDAEAKNGLVPMQIMGFPFMLTKMKVFEAMQKPYFAEPPRWMAPDIGPRKDDLVKEDEFFCHYARKAGFEIFCDMTLSLEIGHIRSEIIMMKTEMKPKAKIDLDLGKEAIEYETRGEDSLGQ